MSDELLCWIDLETTGLNPWDDEILECGIILTEMDLTEVARGSWVFGYNPDYIQDGVHEIVIDMHTENGLWEEVARKWETGIKAYTTWGFIRDWVATHADGRRLYPAGSSVHFDVNFLEGSLAAERVAKLFYHRHFDVSSIKMLAMVAGQPYNSGPPDPHRALGDLDNDINWLRENFVCDWAEDSAATVAGIRI